jgi:hypothetical protein
VDVLAVVDGGTGQLTDRAIDLANGLTFMRGHCDIARAMFEHPSRRA